ncbi:serine/threonine-protein phosphatase [Massilia sp. Dwa41.01b]|uniref:PP2C family protein-serine/threonine phosphatase n=1 Tax=unclassified Massilia TaxID=2609279 RepID=UPI001601C9B8|nr:MULTISPECIES: protein phosphatase 2C domain-containing protein [unclassified Massilia]QNA90047.1 serine/threonine-protein phosphatase [Massilia sp. Dwa41.01b]QNB00936.1 serine/threonine-protein phosphatase [Massilia sp. Se16.2.3]
MQFSVYQQSHIGGRRVNQDRMGYCFTRDSLLLVLADGMGGHQHGEIASTIAMQTLSMMFQMQARPYVRKPERFLEDALLQAHRDILDYTTRHKLPETPRTTVVACLVQHNCAIWAHCGDSRLYWVRGDKVLAQTRDHSHVEHLISRGLATPEERATHPDRNKLYNCLGASKAPRIDVSSQVILSAGDILMLCSDGLWAMVPDAEMVRALAAKPVVQAIPELIALATSVGGPRADNTTALAISWQGAQDEDAGPDVISTGQLPENQVSSIIGSAPPGSGDADPFDEDEIEKAIAEINEAIEKSSQVLK